VNPPRVAVIGLGLIGGSIAVCLRQAGIHVAGLDHREEVAEVARELGLIDEIHGDVASLMQEREAVVLAVPVSGVFDLLPMVDRYAERHTLVLDTGSVKRPVIEVIRALPGASRCVGGHPIAGSEKSGPAHARPDLFRDRTFVLTPTSDTANDALQQARTLVERLGALPVIMDAAEHDRMLARSSHLPQILSTSLALSVHRIAPELAGPGLQSMTRLAASDPAMWRDVLTENCDEVLSALDDYVAGLDRMRDALQRRDGEELAALIAAGAQARYGLFGVAA
jgi:prephenate dehydrogenase